ncbi:carbonyl reductase [NADPH] 1-like [Haliotis rubra]|uniref:carbonyl reductase [NADPH] 1-like n=1 Tax=Haliotis rubra TaxID=36100 RepID=UPI001EE5B912|nr:carbonyl reductase [NADPH] 1-like [Haliotis rubra]
MSACRKVAVVTGGNRGIGISLVRNLCQTFDGAVYLTARNEERGKKAVQDLKAEGLSPCFHQLDIDSRDSICDFAKYLKETYGGVNVIIANGSVSYEKNSPVPLSEQSEGYIRVNNIGNANLYQALEPLLRQDGRYVIVSSGFGQLSHISEKLRPKFQTDNMSIDQLNCVLNEYVTSTKDGSYKEKGWPGLAKRRLQAGSCSSNQNPCAQSEGQPSSSARERLLSRMDCHRRYQDVSG